MKQDSSPQIGLLAAVMLLVLGMMWGGSFFFAKYAVAVVPPLTITMHRVVWAVPVLMAVVWIKGLAYPRDARVWGAFLIMGGLNNAIPFSLIFWAQTRIESGLAAILNGSTAVIGAVVAGILLADERLTPRKISGALLGLAGVAIIIGPEALRGLDPRNIAQLAILGAALSYSLASVWAKVALRGVPPEMNALGMLIGSAVWMVPVAWYVDGPPTLALPLDILAVLGALAVVSTALAYLLYFRILVLAGAANLMLVTLLVPPFAVALGVLFLEETLSPSAWAGFGMIAFGLSVTDGRLWRRLRRGRSAPRRATIPPKM